MATNTAQPTTFSADRSRGKGELWAATKKVLRPLASLRLTVVLFALSIVLVLAGTLAQDNMSIEQVKDTYFKVWIAFLDLQLLFPSGFFPQGSPLGSFNLWLVFPGGKLLGSLMLLNLLAAHTVRFTVQGRGPRLYMGLGVIAVGALVTAAVIASGMNTDSVYQPVLSWEKIWYLLLSSLAGLTLVSVYGAFTVPAEKKLLSWLLIALAAFLLAATVWLAMRTLQHGVADARLEDSSMRILWQLLKGTFAGVVLLVGCVLAFKKRAGIVLLHGGVALLMISELLVNLQALETRITLFENESTNYTYSLQEVELAIVDPLDDETEQVVVIPQHLLEDARETDQRLTDENLPFDIEVLRFYDNVSLLGPAQARQENVQDFATAGLAKRRGLVAQEVAVSAGTESAVDLPAAYVRLYKKGTQEEIGTYLLGVFQSRAINMRLGQMFPIPEFQAMVDLPEQIAVPGDPGEGQLGEKTYDVSLRFKRYYHPYAVEVLDVGRETYDGTETPSDFYSEVRVVDPERNAVIPYRIWMNNPLRYAGHTFYQSGYNKLGEREFTELQVVKNTSWMIPYVSCMIVGVGMLFQFSLTLSRFLNRQQEVLLKPAPAPAAKSDKPTAKAKAKTPLVATPRFDALSLLLGAALVLLCGYWVMREAAPPNPSDEAFDYYRAGQIPVTYEGRLQPLDTMARNQLRIIQGKQTFEACMNPAELAENWDDVREELLHHWPELDADRLDAVVAREAENTAEPASVDDVTLFIAAETGEDVIEVQRVVETVATTKQPAVRWMLDLMANPRLASKHRVFRIENIDLVDQLGLPHRSGLRYSYDELIGYVPGEPAASETAQEPERLPLEAAFDSLVGVRADEMTLYQRKISELRSKFMRFRVLSEASYFSPPEGEIEAQLAWLARLEQMSPPLLAPPSPAAMEGPNPKWQTLPRAGLIEQVYRAQGRPTQNPPVLELDSIYEAYGEYDAEKFNSAVNRYLALVDREALTPAASKVLARESYYNHFEPFFVASVLYFAAFLLVACSWLASGMSIYETSYFQGGNPHGLFKRLLSPESLRLAALALIGLALVVHTWGIWQRMLISGRPPVTNLYSSALFIGWGMVVLGLVLEFLFRRGMAAAVTACTGFGTLLIANFLSGLSSTGDTLNVMIAILDTQFWLATHVVCVTLGYATTFLAGSLGILYVLGGVAVPRFSKEIGKDLVRMIYGILCFAIFFSFVGTVLGGLWADDSWGRFWGWDPKENGALIIVLWNALVLHARWAGMVRDRGLAVLAVAGNITTAWSWFGVNELGIGLHSYGFTEGMLARLGLWCLLQVVVIGIGSIPLKYWLGHRDDTQGDDNIATAS